MAELEVHIEDRVNLEVEAVGFLHEKVKFANAGYPDRIYVVPGGAVVFLEYKRPGRLADPLQNYRIYQLLKRGIIAGWTDDSDTALRFLKTVMVTARLPEAGDWAATWASRWSSVSGSWIGQNFNLSRYIQDLETAGVSIQDAYYRPPTPLLRGMASRD